ncbi:MAG: diguanylate cyclase [Sulfurimonas sp.]|nr:diguanylate cyclase [Sulfurimonas sp.]
MKSSIKNIFKNISSFMTFALIVATISVLFTFEQNNSFKKIDILNTHKAIALSLYELDKKDLELALIHFNGKSTELRHQIEKLHNLYEYDIIGNYILGNSKEYHTQIEKLTALTRTFNTQANQYYKSLEETQKESHESLKDSFKNLNNHISSMIFKNIEYDNKKFQLLQMLAIFTFVIVFIFTFWFQRRLRKIYKDITFLYSPKNSSANHELHTIEADAIFLRLNKRAVSKTDPTNIDPITGINNNKGLESSYSEKKDIKKDNFTAITILKVDNFSKTDRAFPQELTQNMLKKIAYTISLFEQVTDVISRSDYNQFTIILSRQTKEQAFKEIDAIRQSISELKFTGQANKEIQLTVSGAFIIKPNSVTLSNSIDDAKIILEYAKKHDKNKIYQKRDMINV